MAINYVRFLRGTPTAFANVANKDPDTLYFISEKDALTGKLYLGSKLIVGEGTSASIINMEDIANVVATSANNGSILVYDGGQWVAKTPTEIAALICSVMQGATADKDGTSGLVPVPTKDDRNLYLKGDATWGDPALSVRTELANIIGDDNGKTIREVAVDVLTKALIPENAQESLDSLKEIADWIQSHPAEASEFNTRILNLENVINDTTSELESGTVTKEGLVTKVGNLNAEVEALKGRVTDLEGDKNTINNNITSIKNDVTTIYDKLRWHEMTEDGGIEE